MEVTLGTDTATICSIQIAVCIYVCFYIENEVKLTRNN